jgi:predicted ATPase
MYRLDTDKASAERSELAIQSACKQVDVTGVQVMEIKRVSEGTRYRSYVLIALPLGDTNVLRSEKDSRELQRSIETKSDKAFKELNGAEVTPVTPSSVTVTPGEFKLMNVDNEDYKRRRDEALQKPGAVVGQVSVQ